jgi:signal transduction histidine kinase
MVWAVSQATMNELGVMMSNKVITKASRFETVYSTRNAFGFRYRSTRPESRLMCISRQVAWAESPTIRGLPTAELVEHACIAKGDPYCEYHLRWLEERALLPILLGIGAGAAAVLAASFFDPGYLLAAALPMLGGAVGYARELRRADTANMKHVQAAGTEMRALGAAEAETRSEVVAMQQRQQEWSQRLEQQANDRNATLERVVEGLDALQQSRVSSIRGFSHDLRNPLLVVRANTQLLCDRFPDGETGEILEDMDIASLQIESMLTKLMEVATAETGLVKLAPKPVVVAPLADMLRRRLKALVHGRGIEMSVVCSADAPEVVVIDPLVLDRVVDNLLTNAAKYTERGSIRVSVGGPRAGTSDAPGCFRVEISDTGRGIPAAQIERVCRPRPADEPKGPNSYGIGLSSAVRLLAQLGGRLEVSSEVGVGSTFSAHFPAAPLEQKRVAVSEDFDTLLSRVVKVVKVRNAA